MTRPALRCALLHVAAVCWLAGDAAAQPPVHHQYRSDMPTGAIGQQQLLRGGPRVGYYQPVEIVVPTTAIVSVAEAGGFSRPHQGRLLAGMLVGGVYQLRIANIPQMEGEELFPTVEVIDRLYPPAGMAPRFPIPIVLTEEELRAAADGRFVLRVVYIEPPQAAMPQQWPADSQPYFDVPAGEDALHVADRLGRPVAILRMGSRVPATVGMGAAGGPAPLPVLWLDREAVPSRGLESALPAPPRLPLAGPTSEASGAWATGSPVAPGRVGIASHSKNQAAAWNQTWRPPGIGGVWPADEYICDGGAERGIPAVHPLRPPVGVQPEETVAYYTTRDGRAEVAVSNRVCLYAPRFAAVRQLWAPVVHERHERMAGVERPLHLVSQEQRLGARTALQPEQLAGQVGLDQVQRIRQRTQGRLVDQVAQLVLTADALMPHEKLALIERGVLDGREGTKLARGVAAARMWASDLAVQVVLDGDAAVEARSQSVPQETAVYQTRGTSRLRLCKIADRGEASSGQIVTFTLRFDNVGEQPLGEVTLVDHLSPRLELVEGSAQCSRPAQFESHLASEGRTQVLRWVVPGPLGVGEGGVIRFQARVR